MYVHGRMLIPVPDTIARHSSLRRVFGEATGLCSLVQAKSHRRWLKLDHGPYSYNVFVWNKLTAGATVRYLAVPFALSHVGCVLLCRSPSRRECESQLRGAFPPHGW